MKKARFFLIVSTIIIGWFFMPQPSRSEIDRTTLKRFNLKVNPLDISTSGDGRMLFILTPGEILVYSLSDAAMKDGIRVDKAYDRLAYDAQKNALVLSSGSEKKLEIIQIAIRQHIDISGSPFKGPENAPVIIAVFSDYQ